MDPNISGLILLAIIIIVFAVILELMKVLFHMTLKDSIDLFIRCPQIPAFIIVATAVICNLLHVGY